MTYLTQVTFEQLSYRLSGILGRPVSYKQLYHVSVYNLLDAGMIRRNPSDMTRAIDYAIRYISLRMTLNDVSLMYKMQFQEVLHRSLVDMLILHSDVHGPELAAALNVTSAQEQLLTRVRIVDAQILLGIQDEIFMMTTERIGDRIIKLGAETVVLFTPIGGLLSTAGVPPEKLPQMRLPDILKPVSPFNIDEIFKRMRITKDSQNFLFSKSFGEIAAARNVPIPVFASWHVFRVFWEFKSMITGKLKANRCMSLSIPPAKSLILCVALLNVISCLLHGYHHFSLYIMNGYYFPIN